MTELSEQQIQNKIIRDAKKIPYKGRTLSDYIVHVPNGGKRSKRVAAGLKHSGVKSGYPDLVIDIARNGYHGLTSLITCLRFKSVIVSLVPSVYLTSL